MDRTKRELLSLPIHSWDPHTILYTSWGCAKSLVVQDHLPSVQCESLVYIIRIIRPSLLKAFRITA